MKKRIVITGATGFLGSKLTAALVNLGHEVIVLKRKTSNIDRIQEQIKDVFLHEIHESNLATPFRQHGQVDALIHAATCHGRDGEPASQISATNTTFPLRLMETAAANNVTTFYNIDTILPPYINPYSLSKFQFVEWGRMLSAEKIIRFINIKMEHFYGPGDSDFKFTTHVIKNCLKNVPELAFTLGEQKRDFIYVDDAVSACLKIMDRVHALTENYLEYEVGTGNTVSIRQFVEMVMQLTNSSSQANFGAIPYRKNEMMDCKINIQPLKLLGWRNKVDLVSGIKFVVDDLRKQQTIQVS